MTLVTLRLCSRRWVSSHPDRITAVRWHHRV